MLKNTKNAIFRVVIITYLLSTHYMVGTVDVLSNYYLVKSAQPSKRIDFLIPILWVRKSNL